MSLTIHATCVAIGGRGVLLRGPSGSGKSDLALRLIDRGAALVGDDYVVVAAHSGGLIARPAPNIAGQMEVRGIGIVELPFLPEVRVCLVVDLADAPVRMPEPASETFECITIPKVELSSLEASAPIKVEMALNRFGLPIS
ncbi:MAG: aldolase [Alphaproteobacteria bacterium]|nr:MAG: aldolase [Alphaproteobacteria bacterium]